MEDARGVARGSYIWGRSVHNTRIEHLWYDVTHGFGQKWKKFFIDLEVHEGLNPQVPAHIWLLHHLFLHHINADAQEWADAWNSHVLSIRHERNRSPRDIFLFSMLQDGPRGLEHRVDPIEDEVDDPDTYGIDWDTANDPTLMNHLLTQNPHEWEEQNPFAPGLDNLSHVPCDTPDSPFTVAEINELDRRLGLRVDLQSRSMHVRRLVWREAMEICSHFYD
ncbi:hypothetical protein FB45DRAFT_983870 [Roridomyces roridus]|uniref:Integrase core domain-containing protein n=1 Tax=Roridomyces roridus TaxID=1738132 RepID=A0AAD7AY49_9AGAR|nr:hypothetical protein FB45DRAFT_983870 [Roridomyces roridus]